MNGDSEFNGCSHYHMELISDICPRVYQECCIRCNANNTRWYNDVKLNGFNLLTFLLFMKDIFTVGWLCTTKSKGSGWFDYVKLM